MKYKIKKIRKLRDMTQVELVNKAKLSQPYLSQLENGSGGRAPSMETLAAIAKALQVAPSDLFDDAKPIAVAGKVGAGAKIPLIDTYEKGDGLYHVACPPGLSTKKGIVAVEVEGDSMTPAYNHGDVLFYTRDVYGVPTEVLNRVCICEDENNNVWVKQVRQGTEAKKFNLVSINPMSDNMPNVNLIWASPVRLVWPAEFVERVEL